MSDTQEPPRYAVASQGAQCVGLHELPSVTQVASDTQEPPRYAVASQGAQCVTTQSPTHLLLTDYFITYVVAYLLTAVRPTRRTGQHCSPSPTTTTQSPFALPGAMAAGIAPRYKIGLRLATYR